jgi:hypothetical protein
VTDEALVMAVTSLKRPMGKEWPRTLGRGDSTGATGRGWSAQNLSSPARGLSSTSCRLQYDSRVKSGDPAPSRRGACVHHGLGLAVLRALTVWLPCFDYFVRKRQPKPCHHEEHRLIPGIRHFTGDCYAMVCVVSVIRQAAFSHPPPLYALHSLTHTNSPKALKGGHP